MRLFGVEEARKFVPFLLEAFGRVRGWLDEARSRAALLEAGLPNAKEGALLKAEIDTYAARIRDELARLEQAGIEIKSVDGLVDFRATFQGRVVYLCWKYPEPTVEHWHELETGFEGRRMITDPEDFNPSFLS
jgi:hypothetical protein